ncbi:efflux RND transporter periplasmic adaptor subunit [Candidatus Venteria ishoeyi]|uniref:Putative efflux pump membrane fusion protein n=1 Tax=Candidatus Venteria ishoeyi TaxID=1899563 RepID=A0A1H6FEE3_9GAMM|nr:efflux RND transporter periplasmic adaptor subunit [Candidatus Venteria ishoeyi]MDM8546856.1 efflux RND transporter periplasmic adaptor subunit [Candidatus Venteria ishoeyi]SEH08448.1 putative efflux pump membrane fusion protein [Candidatus Venteria ishoeyi]
MFKLINIPYWIFSLSLLYAGMAFADTEHNQIITVSQHSVDHGVPVGGTVVPLKSVTLAAELPGRIQNLAGEEGDNFPRNEVLLTLNNEDLRAQRNSAYAEWVSADAALRNAGVQYQRQLASPNVSNAPGGMGLPNMFDQIFVNPMSSAMGTRQPGAEYGADIYASGTRIEQARQTLIQARSRISQIDEKLRDSRALAPFDGTIIKKFVEIGDTVQPGQPLLEFAQMSQLQIVADVPTRLSKNIRKGDHLEARLDTEQQWIPITVATIFPMADPDRHTLHMKFNLPADIQTAAGIYAEVRIADPNTPKMAQLFVPASAIVYKGGMPMVFVVDAENRVELNLLQLGETQGANEVMVLSGLNAEDRIVNKPVPQMVSGMQIKN